MFNSGWRGPYDIKFALLKRIYGSGGGVTASSGRGVHGRHQGAVGTAEKKVPTADVESQVTDSISHRSSDSAARSTPGSNGGLGGVSTPPQVVIKSAAAAVLHGASIVAGGGEEPTPRSAAAMSRATEELQHNLRHNIDSVHNVMTALFLASAALMISPKFLMLHVRTLAIGTAFVMSLKTPRSCELESYERGDHLSFLLQILMEDVGSRWPMSGSLASSFFQHHHNLISCLNKLVNHIHVRRFDLKITHD